MSIVLHTYRKKSHPRNSEEPQGWEPTDVADTLNVFDNSENRTPILIPYGFEPGVARRLDPENRFYEEVAPTLRNNAGDNQAAVAVIPLEGNGQRPSHHGDGYGKPGDPSFTLNAVEYHGVAVCTEEPLCLEMTSTKNMVATDGISPTLTARMGTGGNQVNAVLRNWVGVGGDVANTIDANYYKGPGNNWSPREVVTCLDNGGKTVKCVGNGQMHQTDLGDQTGALNCMHDQQCVLFMDDEPAASGSFVRRLTPRECERLQAFPDDWTDIGEWTDSKNKNHKRSDSARYKAIGNSIALPFWDWLLGNISDTYKGSGERPTLGSLFDGIGGFPLCWERHNGKGSAIWASEIDEFCIAVTKERFGEEE